jgi:dTMP kinase
MTAPRFIVLEGPDGCGKSTQAALLQDSLTRRGVPVEHLRDPGGTAEGDAIRRILLQSSDLDRWTETFLFLASRSRMVHARVIPALAAGRTVVCERFTLSTVVYQGHARGLAGAELDALRHTVALSAGGRQPDLVLLLDAPEGGGLARKDPATLDGIEARGPEFQERVRAGYLAEAPRVAGLVHIPPASVEATALRIAAEVDRVLGLR